MIDIDPTSPVPLYLQISEQLRKLIAIGALRPGDRLPTIRELAVHSRVNRNTAARAIQHLEGEALVRTRVGQGTFVLESAPRVDVGRRGVVVDDLMDRMLVEAQTLGMPLEELESRLKHRLDLFRARRKAASGNGPSGDTGNHDEDRS